MKNKLLKMHISKNIKRYISTKSVQHLHNIPYIIHCYVIFYDMKKYEKDLKKWLFPQRIRSPW